MLEVIEAKDYWFGKMKKKQRGNAYMYTKVFGTAVVLSNANEQCPVFP